MIHSPEIWDCIVSKLPKKRWVVLDDIYTLIEHNLNLDAEDYEGQSPSSKIPKWKRNVRNVLQNRKETGKIEWNKHGSYRL
jgi:hypothetical protein